VKRLLVAVLVAAYVSAPAAAVADTPGCVSRAEYDNMERLLSTGQVAGRFDTSGWYIGSGPERFRRGYDSCWSDDRIVVVWYSLNTGLSDDWDVRDR
jgi:hypothetical protein